MINKCSGGKGGNVHSQLSGLQSRIPEFSSLAEGTKGSTDGLFGRLKAERKASKTKSKRHSYKFPPLPRPRCRMKMEMKLVEGDMDVIVPLGLIKAKRKSSSRSQAGPKTLPTLIPWNTLSMRPPEHSASQAILVLIFVMPCTMLEATALEGWIPI